MPCLRPPCLNISLGLDTHSTNYNAAFICYICYIYIFIYGPRQVQKMHPVFPASMEVSRWHIVSLRMQSIS